MASQQAYAEGQTVFIYHSNQEQERDHEEDFTSSNGPNDHRMWRLVYRTRTRI